MLLPEAYMYGDKVFRFEKTIDKEGIMGPLLIKKSATKYDILYPETAHNGYTFISNRLVRLELDVSTGTLTETGSYDLRVATGFDNPIPFAVPGYDMDRDRILLVVGEWDGSSNIHRSSQVKLVAIYRDLSAHDILIDDVVSLVRNAIPDVDQIRYYGSAWIVNGLGLVTIGAYAGDNERSALIISTDDGNTWTPIHANSRYDYVQQRIEPIWDGNTFLGFLTEGHGTNSHWVRIDGSVVPGSPGGLFTTEPVYDMINNKVIWIEWGSATGAPQGIYIANPSSPFDATDKTPSGTITDGEGNVIDLSTVCKSNGAIYSDGTVTKLLISGYRGGIPSGESRIIVFDLSITSADIGATQDGTDRFSSSAMYILNPRAIDPVSRKLIPVPLYVAKRVVQ